MNANRLFWLSISLMLIMNLRIEAQPNITQAEYFFDADPGFGNASQLSISGGIDISSMNASLNVNSLSNGLHLLFVRAKSSAGWSLTNKWQFLKTTMSGNLQKAEYFFNSDPGLGKGTPITITPSGNISNLSANLDMHALQTGLVVLYIQTQDAAGNWSLANAWRLFYEPRLGLIDKVEYSYDADPGFGNGIPVAINSTSLLQDYLVPVNVTGLASGDHSIYWRAHSSRGWSITNIDTFAITTASPAPFINVNSITQKVNCA